MGNKLFLILLFSLLLSLSLVSSEEYDSHKLNTDFSFSISSNNATSCQVTTANTPYGVVYLNQVMTNNSQSFNATISKNVFNLSGDYCFNIVCSDGINFATGNVCREVNIIGTKLTQAKANTYIIILIFSILIFAGILYFGLAMPDGNKRDEMSGYILAVSNLKYLKYFLLCLSYVFLVWISYFSWMIVYAFLDFEFLSNIFRFIFTALAITTLPLFILFTYLTIANLVRDSKIADSLMRGLRIR